MFHLNGRKGGLGLWRTEDARGSSIPSLSRGFPGPQGVQAGASGLVVSSRAVSQMPWAYLPLARECLTLDVILSLLALFLN